MSENLPEPQDPSSQMMDGILKEMERLEKIHQQSEPQAGHERAAQSTSADREVLPFLHVRMPLSGWNPAFAKGVELARFKHGNKLEEDKPFNPVLRGSRLEGCLDSHPRPQEEIRFRPRRKRLFQSREREGGVLRQGPGRGGDHRKHLPRQTNR